MVRAGRTEYVVDAAGCRFRRGEREEYPNSRQSFLRLTNVERQVAIISGAMYPEGGGFLRESETR